jgi:DNA-binding LytR/AlgR family response regulator
MNCVIIDDEEISRNILIKLIQQVEYLNLIKACSGPIEGLEILRAQTVDLLFLDVEMPEMSGIDLIRSLETKPLVIMTTSHKKYAFDAFECNVVDYLVKPVEVTRFMKAVSKARDFFMNSRSRITATEKDYCFIKSNYVLTKLLYKDILWIEALGDYVTINTATKKYILHLTLKAMEGKLSSEKFVRVHRSFIVMLEHISAVDDTTIYVQNKSIPVGALYRENFMKKLNLLM